jgi:hypothetical protein
MSRAADTAACSSIRAKPAVVNGAPRSDTNMNGEAGASRCRRRNALISRPVRGCVLGVPFFALRTCRAARAKSTPGLVLCCVLGAVVSELAEQGRAASWRDFGGDGCMCAVKRKEWKWPSSTLSNSPQRERV